MSNWIACGAAFIVADVVRWTEPAFAPRLTRFGRKVRAKSTRRNVCIGEREIVAEVLSGPDPRGLITFLVRAVRVTLEKGVQGVTLPKKEEEIRRRRSTLVKGKVHRLAWSDESARSIVASEFLNGE
jgi:hypothetical protein